MNENDLLISIGADLSSYNASLKQAETTFINMSKKLSKTKFKTAEVAMDLKQYYAQLENATKAWNRTRDKLEATAVELGFDTSKMEKQLDDMTTDVEKANAKIKNSAKETADAQRDIRKKLRADLKRMGIDVKANASLVSLKKQLAVQSQLTKQALNEQRIAAQKETKLAEDVAKRKIRLAVLIAKTQKRLAKEIADKEIKEQKRALALREKTWALMQRQAIAVGRASSIAGKGTSDGTATWDFAGHRGLIDSTKVVAKYGAISQALYGMQAAYRAVAAEIIRFDQSIYNNMAVLGASEKQARLLAKTTMALSQTYGGNIEDMAEAMLTLGRAGFEIGKGTAPLQKATKVLAELAMITGDSMTDGAAGVATLVSVYPDLINEIDKLGNQMAIVANATRLGLKDFTTISNYALTTAASIGLNSEAYLALAGAMSRVGLNASTIGTSIRRLKKFTDSAADSMKVFFRYLGISQKEFAGLLQSGEGSTAALIAFSRQLNIVSKDKAKYTAMTKNLNIQEKATVDTLRLIGQADYLTKMVAELQGATKESKQLEEQAKRMAQGLGKAFERVGNMISQTFNDLGETISNILFDTSSAQAFTESLNDIAKVIVFLIKQIPLLTIAWVAYAIKMSVVSKAIDNNITKTKLLSLQIKKLGAGILAFIKANPIILALTAAFTAWNIVSTKRLEIQQDLNKLIEEGTEALKEHGEAQLKVARTGASDEIDRIKEEIQIKKDSIEVQKSMLKYSGAMGGDTYDQAIRGIDETEEALEFLQKRLIKIEKLLGDVTKQQKKFSDTPLDYAFTPEDVANLEKIKILGATYNKETTASLLAFNALQSKQAEAIALAKEEWTRTDNETKQIAAQAKIQEAAYRLLMAKKKITSTLVSSQLKLTATEAKIASYTDKSLVSTIALNALEEERSILVGQRNAISQIIATRIKEEGEEYKKTAEYSLLVTEENKAGIKVADNKLKILKEQNKELDKTVKLIYKASEYAIKLNQIFSDFVYNARSSARAIRVMLGELTKGQADVANQKELLDNAKIANKLAQDDLKAKKDAVKLLEDQSASETAIKEAKEKVRVAQVAVVNAQKAQNTQTVAFYNIQQQNALTDIEHEKQKTILAAKKLNIDLKGLSTKERAVRETDQERKLLDINLKYAKKALEAGRSRELSLAVGQAELAIEQHKEKLAQKIFNLNNTTTSNRADKAARDKIRLARIDADLANERYKLAVALEGRELTSFETAKLKLEILKAETGEAQKAWYAAIEAARVGGGDKAQLEVKKAEIEYTKALAIELATATKNALDFRDAFKLDIPELGSEIFNPFEELIQSQKDYANNMKQAGDDEKERAKITSKYLGDQIKSYSKMAGGMKSMFKEGTKGYKAFDAAQKIMHAAEIAHYLATLVMEETSLAVKLAGKQVDVTTTLAAEETKQGVMGITALIAQLQLPFPANIPAFAMVAAAIAALGVAVSGGLSGSAGGEPSKPAGYTEDTTEEYASDSIVDVLERIYDVQYPMLDLTRSMRDALVGVINNITDLVKDFQLDGLDFDGSEFVEMIKESSSFTLDSIKLLLGSGTLEDFVNGTVVGVLETWGLYQKDTLLSSANELQLVSMDILSDAMMGQISDAIVSMADTIYIAGASLGLDQAVIDNALATIELDFGTIDTTDLSEQEIIDKIAGTISYAFDDIIRQTLPELNAFREAGEGYYETLVRITIETEQAGVMFEAVGKSISSWIESAEILKASGGLSAFTSNMNDFMSLFTEDEQLAMQIEMLTKQFDALGVAIPQTNQDFIDLVNSTTDPELYADLLSLSGAFGELDRATDNLASSISDIVDAWLSDLSYLTIAQKDLLASEFLDIAKEDDTISTIDAARSAAEASMAASATKEEYIPAFERYILALEDEIPEATNDDIVTRLDTLIIAIREMDDTLIKTQPEDIQEVRIVS